MSGSLIKIDEEIVTSAVASVTLTGIDSTYDVYVVKFNNVTSTSDNDSIYSRFTVSGTPDTSANYDYAIKLLQTNATFGNLSGTNGTNFNAGGGLGTGTGETAQTIFYLFNFNNASEYSFITWEATQLNYVPNLAGAQGGVVLTVAQACDGMHFYTSTGNIASGTFTLYGLKK